MMDRLRHRGPDGAGLWDHGEVCLGHRRLSIIDLASGQQPMSTPDGRYTTTYNGEIYNYVELRKALAEQGHSFRTRSDTEVLLQNYAVHGPEGLHRLNGMFAFAVWDQNTRTLFAARDRLGVKPLYYFWNGHRFVFASEIKAILVDPEVKTAPDYEAIASYLAYQYVPSDRTFFAGIRKLLPGHYLTLSQHKHELVVEQYWSPVRPIEPGLTEADAAEGLRELLKDSVRMRLRSDVPVGVHLSGGVDSSSVAAFAASAAERRLQSFTGKFTHPPGFDESPYAREVAKVLGMDYHEIEPDASEFLPIWRRLVWFMDEPVAGPGAIPQFVVSRLAAQHVKVVLGGQGGDELFGGYNWYRLTAALYLIKRLGLGRALGGSRDWPLLRGALGDYGLRRLARAAMQTGLSLDWSSMHRELWQYSFGFPSRERRQLITVPGLNGVDVGGPAGLSTAGDLLTYDVQNYLPALLTVEDRTSMAASLESRVPLLDFRIAELAQKLPADLRMPAGTANKPVLRRAVQGITPSFVLDRKDKKGFPTPLGAWLRGEGRATAHTVLLGPTSRTAGRLFHRQVVEHLLDTHWQGADRSRQLWMLLNVEFWFRTFIDPDSEGESLHTGGLAYRGA